MIGERAEHPNFGVDVGGTKIKGPRNSDGWLAGDPLGEEYVAVIEPAGGGDEIVTLSLHAGRLAFAFKVAPVDSEDEPMEIDLMTTSEQFWIRSSGKKYLDMIGRAARSWRVLGCNVSRGHELYCRSIAPNSRNP